MPVPKRRPVPPVPKRPPMPPVPKVRSNAHAARHMEEEEEEQAPQVQAPQVSADDQPDKEVSEPDWD